jgi:sugar-specific transcriptional regulator TrmB
MNNGLKKEIYDLSSISHLLNSEYNNNLREAFSKLGLNAYDAKILLSLFVLKESEAKTLGEVANVPLGRIYTTLENLVNRDLVHKIKIKGKPLRYRANDYEQAIKTIYSKVIGDIEKAHSTVRRTITNLQEIEVEKEPDFPIEQVEVVFGEYNISQILRENILSTQEEITMFLSLVHLKSQKSALENLVRRKTNIFAIGTNDEEIRELESIYIHCDLLPPVLLKAFEMFFVEKNAIFNGIMIDNQKLFLILQEANNEPYGLFIRHPSLVQTFSILVQTLRSQIKEG